MATKFIKNGAKVVITDILHQLGQDAAVELRPNATFVSCDVTRESDISDAVDFTVSKHGRLDIMYNNGIVGNSPPRIVDLDMTEFDRIMSINVQGVVVGIKHAARFMMPRHSGCILCTGSVTVLMGGLSPPEYSISKGASLGSSNQLWPRCESMAFRLIASRRSPFRPRL
ncbi:PREDICTED: tropinone reductase-like 1 [Nelumbo nucifera]|uniref:Tropinone reductase-like 1 n=2 Tax=Nelumbo nucifera TaxID=4432 RepID=A0A1U8Q4P2_NELNU|nr:PREDICTED: tropinone reductase-like 1 [Nelumbo nucifera]DAD40312.1 TPA_asm: hypothetical protein HUJ06_014635 [Nelumbo nucifera]